MDSLPALVSFVRAAHAGSFAAAARQLGVTRAAIGQNVKRLEDQLGVRLIARSTRSFALTEHGERLLTECADAVATLERASEAVRDDEDKIAGVLRITATEALGRRMVLPLLRGFRDSYPDVEIDMRFGEGMVDMVGEGFDLGLRIGELRDAAYVARKLFDVRMRIVASADYLARRGLPESPEDVLQHDCIGFRLRSSGEVLPWMFDRGARSIAVPAKVILDEPGAVADAARAGLGLAQVGSHALGDMIERGDLQEVMKGSSSSSRAAYVVYPSAKGLSRKIRAFIDYLAEQLT